MSVSFFHSVSTSQAKVKPCHIVLLSCPTDQDEIICDLKSISIPKNNKDDGRDYNVLQAARQT